MCELTSSTIQTHYTRMTIFVYVCESPFRLKTAEHFLQKQCTVCAAFADADAFFLERLLSGLSYFCAFFLLYLISCSHSSQTASNSNPPYWKMANFRKASDAKSMFIGLKTFLTNQDRPYTSAPERLEICKCQRMITPSTLNNWLRWQ